MPTVTIARTFYLEIDGATGVPTGFIYCPDVPQGSSKFTLDATSIAALGLKDLKNASGSKYRIAINARQTTTQGHPNNLIGPTEGTYTIHHNSKTVTGATIT